MCQDSISAMMGLLGMHVLSMKERSYECITLCVSCYGHTQTLQILIRKLHVHKVLLAEIN